MTMPAHDARRIPTGDPTTSRSEKNAPLRVHQRPPFRVSGYGPPIRPLLGSDVPSPASPPEPPRQKEARRRTREGAIGQKVVLTSSSVFSPRLVPSFPIRPAPPRFGRSLSSSLPPSSSTLVRFVRRRTEKKEEKERKQERPVESTGGRGAGTWTGACERGVDRGQAKARKLRVSQRGKPSLILAHLSFITQTSSPSSVGHP